MTRGLRQVVTTLGWAVLVFLLVLPGVFGSFTSIAAMLALLLLVPVLLLPGASMEVARQPALVMFVAAFLLLLGAFAVTARNPGNLLYATNFLALPLAAAAYVLARRAAGRQAVLTIATLCILGVAACTILGFYDVVVRRMERVIGIAMGGNLMARLSLVLGFIALCGVFATASRWRFLFYLGPLLALVCQSFAASRGAVLGLLPMVLGFGALVLFDRANRGMFLWLMALGAAAFVAADLVFGGIMLERLAVIVPLVIDALSGTTSPDIGINERTIIYSAGWSAFLASPWVGHGWANFAAAASAHIDMTLFGGPENGWFQFHNDFLNFAAAAGIPGVAALLLILAAPFAGVLAGPRDALFRARLYAAIVLSLGTAVFGLTDITLGYDLPTSIYAVLTAITLGAWRIADAPGR